MPNACWNTLGILGFTIHDNFLWKLKVDHDWTSWSSDHQWTNECLLQFAMSWYPDMLKDILFLFSLYKLQVIVFISQTLDMIYKIKIARYKSGMQYDPSSMHHQPLGPTLQLNFKFYKKTMVSCLTFWNI
jgi:hypothetical protein